MNPLREYKVFVRNNLPSGIEFNSDISKFVVNDKRFNTFKEAEWYLNYIKIFGFTTSPIEAVLNPVLNIVGFGETPSDNFVAGQYTSSAGTITSQVAQASINGGSFSSSNMNQTLSYGDIVTVREIVTDSASNSITISTGQQTVPFDPPGQVQSITFLGLLPLTGSVSWSEPSFNGGTPITAYDIEIFNLAGNLVFQQRVPATPLSFDASPIPVGSHRVRVRAVNIAGVGDWPSDGGPFADIRDIPGAMNAPTLVGGEEELTFNFADEPNNDGGGIDQYEYEIVDSGDNLEVSGSVISSARSTSIVVPSVAEGDYRARNRATNVTGSGPWSPYSPFVSVTAPSQVPWSYEDAPGLLGWYSARAPGNVLNASNEYTFVTDLSGNGNHLTTPINTVPQGFVDGFAAFDLSNFQGHLFNANFPEVATTGVTVILVGEQLFGERGCLLGFGSINFNVSPDSKIGFASVNTSAPDPDGPIFQPTSRIMVGRNPVGAPASYGVDGGDPVESTSTASFATPQPGLRIGNRFTPGGGAQEADGWLLTDMIIYAVDLSLQNRFRADGKAAWDINRADILPSDHPHKNNFPTV